MSRNFNGADICYKDNDDDSDKNNDDNENDDEHGDSDDDNLGIRRTDPKGLEVGELCGEAISRSNEVNREHP